MVDGTAGANSMAVGYTDAQGDQISTGIYSITAGSGNDTVAAGGGNDAIYAGDGADSASGGDGNEQFFVGAGHDRFGDWNTYGGDDTVYGGDGDDTLISAGGKDQVHGDAGNDQLSGGTGKDQVYGGTGNDVMWVSEDHQIDSAYGGEETGDFDRIEFGNYIGTDGVTVTFTGNDAGTYGFNGMNDASGDFTGNDGVYGTAYTDTMNAAANTTAVQLSGNAGAGNDKFRFETGSGRDVVTDFDLGDADGDGLNNDQFDVSDLQNPNGSAVRVFDIVVTDDGFGNAVLNFPGIETITLQGVSPVQAQAPGRLNAAGIPCFTPGVQIATDAGPVSVERLRPGHRVRTLDHGDQPVRWVGCRTLDAADLAARPDLRPVMLRKGALGNGRTTRVSPQHGFLVNGALVRAKHLVQAWSRPALRIDEKAQTVTYVHVLCDRHEIVFTEGIPTETLYPGPVALRSLGHAGLIELVTLIPDLIGGVGRRVAVETDYGPPSRPYRRWSAGDSPRAGR